MSTFPQKHIDIAGIGASTLIDLSLSIIILQAVRYNKSYRLLQMVGASGYSTSGGRKIWCPYRHD